MKSHLIPCSVVAAAILLGSLPVFAQAGGAELRTDDPYFPGEGAMSTPARVLQHANATPRGSLGSASQRDKLIRLFLWRAEHYSHLFSPMVYNLPGVTPGSNSNDTLMVDYDAMRALFSYGWGVCGTNHAQMRVFADAAGWNSRRRSLAGDTGYEIEVDGAWRYVNTDQYTLHFLSNSPTAHFASLNQVVTTDHHYIEWNPDLGMGYRLPQANAHGGYADFAGVTGTVANRSLQWRSYYGEPNFTGVWQKLDAAKDNDALYGEGYTTTPVNVRIKRGETFTRWLQPGGVVSDLGLAGRLWWGFNGGNMGGGDASPYSQYSFVQNAPARDEVPGGAQESRGEQRYGNGCFDWQPNLALGEHLDGAAEVTGTLTAGGAPALRSTGNSTLILLHNSPYTIAGRPADATDPAKAASDGAVVTATTIGSVGVEISVNAGATWSSLGDLSGTGVSIDFTNAVKGRNQYLLRLSFNDGEGLASLRLRTITMLNQAVYPNLKSTSAQVSYAASNAGALELSPDLWSAATANSATGYVQKVADSGNLSGVYYVGEATGLSGTNNNPLSVTYKITIPPQLAAAGATWKQIFGASNSLVSSPPDGGPYTQIEISPNQTAWTKIGEYLPPSDDAFSAYWAYGRSSDAAILGGTTYYVKFTTFNGSHPAKIRYLRLSATYTMPASSSPLEATWHWNNGAPQSSSHTVAAGAASDAWTIATGANVVQNKVVLAIPSAAAVPTAPVIGTPPASVSVTEGQTATFSVAASGSTPLSYLWTKNGATIAGATGASYTTPATALADNGAVFRVTVTNTVGSALSNPANLIVNPAGGGAGTPVTTGFGAQQDTYIDQFDPTNTFGGIERMEIRSNTGEKMNSLMQFDLSSIPPTATVTSAQLSVYNTRGNNLTATDVLVLEKVLGVWTEAQTWAMGVPATSPTGVVCPTVTTLTDAATPPELYVITGLGTLVQDWVTTPAGNHGLMLSVASNMNLRLATSEHPTTSIRPLLSVTYTVAGGAGSLPTLSVQPGSVSAEVGRSATFSITATGTGPFTYQWLRNGTAISGATGASYTTPALTAGDDGDNFQVVVTNGAGSVTSNPATLTVTPAGLRNGSGNDHNFCGPGSVAGVAPSGGFAALGLALMLLALSVRPRA